MKIQNTLILSSRELNKIENCIRLRIMDLSDKLTKEACNPDEFKLSAQDKALYQIEHRDLKNLITAFETT